MTEFEQSIAKIEEYISQLEADLLAKIAEKNELIRLSNVKQDEIAQLRIDLKEWRNTHQRLTKGTSE